MIISRTVTVPLSSLSRKAKMDSMASFSPRSASFPIAAASSRPARVGGGEALEDDSESDESSESEASESDAPPRASLCACFTTRFMISFANALTSNTSAI